jgi:hypothetical protein
MNETVDYKQLRFVASNFLELQGLRQVALGIVLVLMILALRLEEPWSLVLFALLMALLGIAWWRIGKYYEHRFGRVENRAASYFSRIRNLQGWRSLVWIALVMMSLWATLSLNLNILTPGWFLGLLFAGYFALGNRRWYYLLCALPFFALDLLNRPPQAGILTIEIWILPFAFILTGILDHLLLARLLPGVRANSNA